MNAGPAPAGGEKFNACCVLLRHRGPVPTEGERSNEADSNLCLDWNQYCYFPAGDVAGWFDEQGRRHEVRPGISGWAQVHGRNNITWTEKFKLDVWYVDHVSLWIDIKVIFLTIKNVLSSKDIILTTGPFTGDN